MATVDNQLEPAQTNGTKPPLAERVEDTRSRISQVFIFGYLSVIFVLILVTAIGKLAPDVAKDYLLAIGSPLGFIIGYYFKSASE